jgi:hypothetical protein
MPRSDHAFLLKDMAQSRRRDGLWATCLLSASSGYHAEFQEICY